MSALDILIVDDDQDFAESLAELLNERGHIVEVAFTGQDGVRELMERHFDITFAEFFDSFAEELVDLFRRRFAAGIDKPTLGGVQFSPVQLPGPTVRSCSQWSCDDVGGG